MNGEDRIRVFRHFADAARDVTPEDVRNAVRVLFLPLADDPRLTGRCTALLTDEERTRAGRLSNGSDRACFLQRRAFRRYCAAAALGRTPRTGFRETERGRPWLPERPGTWFSFSSCRRGILGAWSPTHGVGVDLEDPSRKLDTVSLARQFFRASEAEAVENAAASDRAAIFLRLWNLKEAALKSIGEGIPFGLDAFSFRLHPAPGLTGAPAGHGGPGSFEAHALTVGGGLGAVVTRRRA